MTMEPRRQSILFVSRRNSLRSVLAQACLLHIGSHRFAAESCGQPGEVQPLHPAAASALNKASISVPTSPPRSWAELWRNGRPRLDIVVTLDERTIATQPIWPGQPITALWSFEDAASIGNPEKAVDATMQILFSLRRRLELLMYLPMHSNNLAALRSDIRELGRMV